MDFIHKPVLFEECLNGLNIKPDGVYVDGTVGGGGHSAGIVEKLGNNGLLLCVDQDEEAIKAAKEKISKANKNNASVIFKNSNFSNIASVCASEGIQKVDGILLDIGVSSYQLDNPERGFSYNNNGSLDMRMDNCGELTARTIINKWNIRDIKDTIKNFGEERWADRIAEFIVKRRVDKEIETTFELVDIIKAAIPLEARRDGPHPAKRTFQALRIVVNDELGVLERVIKSGTDVLKSEGRFCIITFHSLEDRIVKNGFVKMVKPCECPSKFPVCICKKESMGKLVTRKPIIPTEEEVEKNPRSRSAKLRVFEKNNLFSTD